ncbi:MAG: prepilin-type N-terminal cleavage/methylation domain-containing protein [Syntrophorhabdaceae bacterium]
MIRLGQKGFSLIELIIFIIIGAIFIPASLVAFTTVMNDMLVPDHQVKARFYAEQKMEEVTSRAFDNLTCNPGTPNVLTFADSPEGYSRTCLINYVQYNSGTNSIDDAGTATDYKKIIISVTPAASKAYTVSTIISRRPRV